MTLNKSSLVIHSKETGATALDSQYRVYGDIRGWEKRPQNGDDSLF